MSRYLFIVVLVLAGEMVFGLPFHTARYFRPTLLEVFGFTNTQLGDLFALYGIAAMLGYRQRSLSCIFSHTFSLLSARTLWWRMMVAGRILHMMIGDYCGLSEIITECL